MIFKSNYKQHGKEVQQQKGGKAGGEKGELKGKGRSQLSPQQIRFFMPQANAVPKSILERKIMWQGWTNELKDFFQCRRMRGMKF